MEPISLFITLATSTISLARASGLIKTAADKLAAETAADIKGLVRSDFSAGMRALELAAYTTSDREREKQLGAAADLLRDAESQDRLPPHMRGFAAAVLAALLARGSDRGGAQLLVSKAGDHYHQAFLEIHALAQRAMLNRRRLRVAGVPTAIVLTSLLGPGILLGPLLGPGVGDAAARRVARLSSRTIPLESWTDDIGRQAADVDNFARQLGLAVSGRAIGIRLGRDQHGAVISSALVLAPTVGPTQAGMMLDGD